MEVRGARFRTGITVLGGGTFASLGSNATDYVIRRRLKYSTSRRVKGDREPFACLERACSVKQVAWKQRKPSQTRLD